jgi:haloacid dehalogenase superfamily, subfamily IA, variant 3 with third motif having DD or ED
MADKLIIFDMDGVLVNSEPAITNASLQTLAEVGVKAEYDDFKPFTGMGDDKFLSGVCDKYGITYDPAMKARAYEIYIERAAEWIEVFGWSKPILTALHNAGYKLAVASASDIVKVECNLRQIGIDTRIFAAITTGSDVTRKKPAPDIFLKAAEKAGGIPAASLVVEDAVSGIMAAKAAGMKALGVTTSFDAQTLREAGADRVVDSLSELPELIGGLLGLN